MAKTIIMSVVNNHSDYLLSLFMLRLLLDRIHSIVMAYSLECLLQWTLTNLNSLGPEPIQISEKFGISEGQEYTYLPNYGYYDSAVPYLAKCSD